MMMIGPRLPGDNTSQAEIRVHDGACLRDIEELRLKS